MRAWLLGLLLGALGLPLLAHRLARRCPRR